MSSSSKNRSKILGIISAAEAERLLVDLANLPNMAFELAESARRRMRSRYPEIFGKMSEEALIDVLVSTKDSLRKAWDAKDSRHRDWYVFRVRQEFHELPISASFTRRLIGEDIRDQMAAAYERGAALEEPPELTPFEAAMFYFQKTIADRAKHCANIDCPAPYFIAAKRWQKFCSESCAGPANRDAKRKWWHEHKGKGTQ